MKGFPRSCRPVLLIVLVACGHAQTRTAPGTATAPGEPPSEVHVQVLDEQRGNPRFLGDRLYLLGRSETSIAYLTEPADEACGCYEPVIVVQDVRRDVVTWKDSYESGELAKDNASQLKNLDGLWRAKGADWTGHLREHGITPESGLALATLPTGGTAVPRFELHTEHVDAKQAPEGYEHLTSYRIDLVTASGTKTIVQSSSPEPRLVDIEVAGYVPVGIHTLAALVLLETHRGWEGPPSVYRLRVVGAEVPVGAR